MGGAVSNLQPIPYGYNHICIMSYWSDSFRIISGSAQEIDILRDAILENWPKGIQNEMVPFGNTYEFKLYGYPFSSTLENAIACRKIGCSVLQNFFNDRWEILTSSDLTRTSDHLTWFLHKNPNIVPSLYPFICISLIGSDSLLLINATTAKQELVENTIRKVWKKGIQQLKQEGDMLVIKLCGKPWLGNDEEAVYSQLLIQTLINDLHQQQWVLHTSSNLNSDADSLFFRYDPSVVPGVHEKFVLSLAQTDKLRVIGAVDLVIAVVRVIGTFWKKGIQGARYFGNYIESWEFKLKGTPWWASGAEAVSSRFLILKIFETFAAQGWIVSASINSSCRPSDKSLFIFKRCIPMQVSMLCLSFNGVDKIRLINAPYNIVKECREIIYCLWLKGIHSEETYAGCYQIKLNGYPWSQTRYSYEATLIKGILCLILQNLAAKHWRLLVSADVCAKYVNKGNGPNYPLDVHSWYLIQDANLGPSAPATVEHRSSLLTDPPPSYESVWESCV